MAFTSGRQRKRSKATVLTLRFFLQNNESTSLSNVDKLYSNLDIEPQLSTQFSEIRGQINSYLDASSNLSISEVGPMTHQQILDLFIYGDLSHTNNATTEASYRSICQTAFLSLVSI